ncbi:hypothetical protein ABZ383_18720 [Streptomyces sp. NPDC005900]|uniref:nSTAND1 domain-containing NTPase n=1 Tax=Streptomyces sp. NPDC005900 TaxID=3154569 RepID=UPI0033CD468C
MGRHEKPLEPAAGPVRRFAHELRRLRVDAGSPTYRVMAQRVRYSASTLSAAAAGDRLPSLSVLHAYVSVCGGDVDAWERRWYDALAEGAARQPDDGESPYPGLARFGAGDRARFHGRDDLIAELTALTGRRRVVAVIGASGSGKSSLLRAGLIPALRDSAGPGRPAVIRVLTPGAHPVRTHRALLTPARGQLDAAEKRAGERTGDTLLVVDQFEEVFSLCHDAEERNTFLELLLTAREPSSRLRAVLAVRADFYGRCAEHPALAEAIGDGGLLVGPMPASRLREAIVRPAAAEGLIVERALTARIVTDCADEPGGLPLMAHALREVWRRRSGKTLTEAAYDAIGGVRGAVAYTAEEVYAQLDERQALTARSLLLRLVTPGDGTQDTRRPVDRAELPPGCDTVLEHLVRARLLTVDGTTVDLAHEALLTAWPRLRGWIDVSREQLRLHRALTEAAHGWAELERDPGALYRGTRLVRAREAFSGESAGAPELTPLEESFLNASVDAYEHGVRSRSRTVRRTRVLLSVLAVLLCLATVAGAVAWQQSRDGQRERDEAEARRVVGVARTLRTSDPVTSMRLSVAAWRVADLPETREAVRTAAAQREVAVFSGADGADAVNAPRVLSADGRVLTAVVRDRVTQWDMRRGRSIGVRDVPGLSSGYVDVSDDGRAIALHDGRGLVLVDLRRGRPVGTVLRKVGRWDVDGRFGPGGRTFVIRERVRGHTVVQVWDVRRPRKLHEARESLGDGPFPRVSPDGRLLATCAEDGGGLVVEEVTSGRRLPTTWPERFGRQACRADELVFTPDGRAVAVAAEGAIHTRELRSGRQRPRIQLPGADSGTATVDFSEDGAHAVTLAGRRIALWSTRSPVAPLLTLPVDHRAATNAVVDTADGVVRYRTGQVVRTLDVREALAAERLDRPLGAARFSLDGRVLAATQRRGDDWRFQLRDARRGKVTDWLPGVACADCVSGMAFSKDAEVFAYGATDGRGTIVRQWSLGRHRQAAPATQVPVRGESLAVAPAGNRVVVSGAPVTARANDDQRAEIWRVGGQGERERLRRWATAGFSGTLPSVGRALFAWDGIRVDLRTGRTSQAMPDADGVVAAVFSPEGRHLAVADDDGRIVLWNADGAHPLGGAAGGEDRSEAGDAEASEEEGDGTAPVLAFSADGRHLAAGTPDGTVRVWETATPSLPGAVYPVADGPVLALGFTGSEVRVATPYTASRRLRLDVGRAAGDVCERTRGGLGRAQWRTYLPNTRYRKPC